MRIKFNNKLRATVIVVTVILLLVIAVMGYLEYKTIHYKEEKLSLYKYQSKAGINYQVSLIPNIVYDKKYLKEDEIYITEFTDSINASFNYEFKGERTADLKGDYEIIAVLEGYLGKEKEAEPGEEKEKEKDKGIKPIWKKEFIITPKTNVSGKGDSIQVSKDISLDLKKYNIMAKEIIEASKVVVQPQLSILMNVNLKANTDKGPVEDKISESIALPIGYSSFSIEKNEVKEKTGAIEENIKQQLPINMKLIKTYGISEVILIVILLCVIFLTSGISGASPYQKSLNAIFKKHGSRLVALTSDFKDNYENCFRMKSIEDLIKVADEMERPILYRYFEDSSQLGQFYVFDDKWLYVFDLKEDFSNHANENLLEDTAKVKTHRFSREKKFRIEAKPVPFDKDSES